jgi:hypothetical protein
VLREERGLTYGAFSSLSPRRLSGHFGASIDTRTEVTQEAVSGLLDLVRVFAENGPTVEEHERARRFLTGSFVLSRETPGSLVSDEILRLLHELPEDDISTFRERLAAVTREQATEAARRHFDPSVGVLAAVGDASAIRPILERFGETTLWDADDPLRIGGGLGDRKPPGSNFAQPSGRERLRRAEFPVGAWGIETPGSAQSRPASTADVSAKALASRFQRPADPRAEREHLELTQPHGLALARRC